MTIIELSHGQSLSHFLTYVKRHTVQNTRQQVENTSDKVGLISDLSQPWQHVECLDTSVNHRTRRKFIFVWAPEWEV